MKCFVVVEGIDNSGKSTLIKELSKRFPQFKVQPGEGPPRDGENINDRAKKYMSYEGLWMFDRHPVVSQPIYGTINDNVQFIDKMFTLRFYEQNRPLIIYCDPLDRGLEAHAERTSEDNHIDTPEFLKKLETNYYTMLDAYRTWAARHAHVNYRIGDGYDKVIKAIEGHLAYHGLSVGSLFDPFQDIMDFHEKFEIPYNDGPRRLPADLANFREDFMEEELKEYKEAIYRMYFYDLNEEDMEKALDGLVDLTYVTLGTAYLHGFDFREAWRRVHSANMKKVRAIAEGDDRSHRDAKFDVVKPEGWRAPVLTDLVKPKKG